MKISHSARPRNRSSRSSRSPMAGSEMAGAAARGFAPAGLASTGLAVPAIVDPVTWSAMVIGGLKTLPQIATWQGVYRSDRHPAKRLDHMRVYFPANSGGTMSPGPPPAFGSRAVFGMMAIMYRAVTRQIEVTVEP